MKTIILSILFLALSAGQHFTLDIDQTGESTLFVFRSDITYLGLGNEVGLFDGDLLVGSDRWMAYSMIYLSGLYLDRVGSRRKGV